MKSLEERIEAGRSAYLASQEPQVTCFPSSGQIEAILRAAYPELHSDPPGWIAPHEASEEMCHTMDALPRLISTELPEASEVWAAMRQAHLHPEKSP